MKNEPRGDEIWNAGRIAPWFLKGTSVDSHYETKRELCVVRCILGKIRQTKPTLTDSWSCKDERTNLLITHSYMNCSFDNSWT